MAKVVIRPWGSKEYLNDYKQFDRTDGPAVIYPDGKMTWYINSNFIKMKYPNGVWEFGDRWDVINRYPNGLNTIWYRSKTTVWPEL